MKFSCGLLAVALACLPLAGRAEEPPEEPWVLDPIVVVASKRPLRLSEVAGHISVITGRDLERQLTESAGGMFRYEPGVDVEVAGTRFGADAFTIRGIGGNRVAVEIDGVPLRDGFAIGSYSAAGRVLVEPERVRQVEILHGPASVMFGSDALGGVLAFSTWDPDDLVARGEGASHYSLRAGYQSEVAGTVLSGQAAWAGDRHGLLVAYTWRDGHEVDSSAVNDEELDPQDWRQRDFAAKYTLDLPSGHRLELAAGRFEREVRTDVQSLLGYGRFARTTALLGDDRDETTRLSAEYAFDAGWFEDSVVRIYRDDSETRQHTDETRRPPPYASAISRDFRLGTRTSGLEWNGFHGFATGATDQTLGLGLEAVSTDLDELRDGFEHNLDTGDMSNELLGETLPTRDFPNSTTREIGAFVEDVIRLDGGRWEITPALRYEHYRLRAESDPVYEQAFPDAELVSMSESRLTPRIAVGHAFNDGLRVYAQYTQGFRAPPVEDVNIGFELPRFRYRAIPNPELESEQSRGYELGLRHVDGDRRLSLTWFDTRFEDLIESRALRGVDPETGYLEFQSRNIGEARIYGIDLRYDQSLGAWSQALSQWRIAAAASWTRGDNDSNGQPLNSVSPPQAVLGLAWRSADDRFDAALHATFTAQQDRIDETAGSRFAPPASQVLDLSAGWRIGAGYTLRAGVFNLTDETWWRWGDVRSLAPDDPMIPLLARPGRNVHLSLLLEI